ncbi:hypothetical protein AVEN_119376-1 [Araneus ventricosus]|uniref:Uncharacterized protein n=1 Tax=Araneus ventricosus TaxID=182803 RepID=A0A4Y2SH36_ARAVE|nr:hypothetical protein AVEN_22691-1 [Araneus ventricosus]GBN87093.1 hypothetical protein AVEN_260674-1 [Araneus ventricosus]GBN87217.1 hypothetical protein AVEN_87107-1 [Araneus ventricosus]GBN87221.1 hypothetical protein AVEN_119376-1 [Araneus ventricosus]
MRVGKKGHLNDNEQEERNYGGSCCWKQNILMTGNKNSLPLGIASGKKNGSESFSRTVINPSDAHHNSDIISATTTRGKDICPATAQLPRQIFGMTEEKRKQSDY